MTFDKNKTLISRMLFYIFKIFIVRRSIWKRSRDLIGRIYQTQIIITSVCIIIIIIIQTKYYVNYSESYIDPTLTTRGSHLSFYSHRSDYDIITIFYSYEWGGEVF